MKAESIDALLRCFVAAKANSFENLLDPFLKITRLSAPVTIAMTKSSAFFKRIIDRLDSNSKAVVRLNLLRVLRTVCEVHPNRAMLVERYGLLGVVERLSRGGGDGAVLVRELAREIVPTLRPGLKPATGKSKPSGLGGSDTPGKNGGLALAPKRMRRTASEASATPYGSNISILSAGSGGSGISNSTARGFTQQEGGGGGGARTKPARRGLGDIPWQNSPGPGSRG